MPLVWASVFGGLRVHDAIEEARLGVVGPGRYAADRAFRLYDAAAPANPLVAARLSRWIRAPVHAAQLEGRTAMHVAATSTARYACTSAGSITAPPQTLSRL